MDVVRSCHRVRKIGVVVFCMVISSFFSVVGIVGAEAEEAGRGDAVFICSFVSPIELHVDVSLDVLEINVFDTNYTRDAVLSIASSNPEVLGAIKLRVRDLVKSQLQQSFGNASITALNQIPGYQDYVFSDTFSLIFPSAFFELPDATNSEEVISGVLDIGAVVTYYWSLFSESGWNNTYTFVLGEDLQHDYANTDDVDVTAKEITWKVTNWNGAIPSVAAELSVQSANPTSSPSDEQISLAFLIDTRQIDTTSFTIRILVETLSLEPYTFLPQTITALPYATSDAVRLFIKNDLLSWDELYNTSLKGIEFLTITAVETSELNQQLQTEFLWDPLTTINCSDPYNSTHMDIEPALQADIVDTSIDLQFSGITPRAFFGLINAGAQANLSKEELNFGEEITLLGYNYTSILYLPSNLTINGKTPYIWNSSTSFQGVVNSTLQPTPPYSDEHIETTIEIDIEKMDLNIQSILFGKTELTETITLEEQSYYYIFRKPAGFFLPNTVHLTFLNADAFRLCIEESVFSEEEIAGYLSDNKQEVELLFTQLFPETPIQSTINSNLFYTSLSNWDGDITSMEDTLPIELSTYASVLTPLSFSISLWPPAIELQNQTITLQGIPGASVTYEIVFPNGISVEVLSLQDHAFIKSETPEGREFVEVSFDVDESSETDTFLFELTASPLYIFALFFPCLLSFLLVIILIIVVILIKRRGGRRKPIKEPSEQTGYEGQQYYVPPPPPQQ